MFLFENGGRKERETVEKVHAGYLSSREMLAVDVGNRDMNFSHFACGLEHWSQAR